MNKTTLAEWLSKNTLPKNYNGEGGTWESGYDTVLKRRYSHEVFSFTTGYEMNEKGYSACFASENKNLKNDRVLKTLHLFTTSKVVINGAIKPGKSNTLQVKKIFGKTTEAMANKR